MIAWFRQRAETALTVLDANLAERDFLASKATTIADICCYGDVAFAALSGIDLGRWLRVAAWSMRMQALPRFKAPFDLLTMADADVPAS